MDISAWQVRTRLSTGFGAVCALLLLCIGMGLMSMGRMQSDLGQIANERWPRISASSAILSQVDSIAVALRNMMLTQDAGDRQRQVEVIMQARKTIGTRIDELQKTMTAGKEQQFLTRVNELRAQYVTGQDALMALIMADKPDEAKAYLSATLRPLLTAYKTAVTEMIDHESAGISSDAGAATATYQTARTTLIGLGLLALALAAGLGTLITRSLLRELGGEPHAAAELARAVAQGDFTRTVAVRSSDTQSLLAQLSTMQAGLAQVVSQVRRGSESVAMASAEIAQGNQDLSSRTESQASALEQTAASMEELGATVRQNADSARQANELAQRASTVAVRGGDAVGQVVQTMKGINESSHKISDIIGVIDGIAFQTNILALNAAVEAARAGEQGRGFAVVASEVRSLAGRSADAAREIKALIQASVEQVEQGSTLVDQAGVTMVEVVDSIRRVTDLMGEISSASREQASGVAQVSEAVTQMDQTTQQNAALVEEMAAAASSLNSQAQALVESVAVFQLGAEQSAPLAAPLRATAPAMPRPAPAPRAKPAVRAAPAPAARAPATRLATASASADDNWESF